MSLAAALRDAFAARPDPGAVSAASVAVAVDQQEAVDARGVRPGALFQAASISKPVAALVALRLTADGRLNLDGDVSQFLTSWQLPGDAEAEPVTVRHLLCYGGGLSVSGFPVGREWRYAGGGYPVQQQLLEDVTGREFAGLAEDLVLRPAGVITARYAQPDPDDAAAPHVQGRPEARRVHPEHAAAGLWCTPTDLLRPAPAIQAAVAGEAGALWPAGLARQMVTPQLGDWGLGLKTSGEGDMRAFSHGGGDYGCQCAMPGSIQGRNAAAVMTSSDQGVPVLEAMAAAITKSTSWQIT